MENSQSERKTKKSIPRKSENISDWYNKVILETKLADYGPAKGTMIFRPYGYAIWEEIQRIMDKEIKKSGTENAYFPMFIPESLLKMEKEHVKGFSPELAVVTIGGGKELEEKLIVRPTSETIMYEAYSRWINSWRDLPVKINQWNNVVRWEKRTYMFLRTSEFLWQEGHTAHATHEEAIETTMWAIDMYERIYKEYFAIFGYKGRKSESEKFAGALNSFSYESLMPNGKALQSSTSHDLGQNFSKAFNISFQDKDGSLKNVWQTSWGLSTRSIGGLILVHGDDQGLKIPPKLAPIQVVIIPIDNSSDVLEYSKKILNLLEKDSIRTKVDYIDDERLGFKINKWELAGIPLRIEIGKKELQDEVATISRRDMEGKTIIPVKSISKEIKEKLDEIQQNMYEESKKFTLNNTFEVDNYEKFKEIMNTTKGFIKAFWCENGDCEQKIREETKASTRCLPLDSKEEKGKCIHCGAESKHKWLFALSY
jgi:prolyl-tRNA synthetase